MDETWTAQSFVLLVYRQGASKVPSRCPSSASGRVRPREDGLRCRWLQHCTWPIPVGCREVGSVVDSSYEIDFDESKANVSQVRHTKAVSC